MSLTVILERKTTGIMELRRGQFEIVLDGSRAGSIARNQTIELPVEPRPTPFKSDRPILKPRAVLRRG